MLIVALVSYPFFQNLAKDVVFALRDNSLLLFVGLLKGGLFWCMSYAGQFVRRTSNSTAMFFPFIAIVLVALGNSFMGEALSRFQWFSVVALSLIGLYFSLRGHLSTQSLAVRLLFVMMVVIGAIFGFIDHYFLSRASWYGLLLLTGLGLVGSSVLASYFMNISYKKAMFAPLSWKTGLLFGVTEVVILAILVTHLPVTVGMVAMMLAGPFMMIVASLIWGGGSWRQQLFVGSVSYVSALPIVLGF